jgi:hypothetical protein
VASPNDLVRGQPQLEPLALDARKATHGQRLFASAERAQRLDVRSGRGRPSRDRAAGIVLARRAQLEAAFERRACRRVVAAGALKVRFGEQRVLLPARPLRRVLDDAVGDAR